MMKLAFKINLKKWTQIFSLERNFLNPFIFRGQSDSKWTLQTSIERAINECNNNDDIKWDFEFYEKWMLHDFKRKYPLYSGIIPKKDDPFEWLAIMQHHGAATRLLDFTESLFIAFYFASIESRSDSAVWLINRLKIRDYLKKDYNLNYNRENALKDEINLIHIDFANTFIGNQYNYEEQVITSIIPLEPKICTERLSKQQGLFLMQTNSKASFEQNLFNSLHIDSGLSTIPFQELINILKTDNRNVDIIKIVVPKEIHKEIISALYGMNITAETLFPGLDGLAKSLTEQHIRQR